MSTYPVLKAGIIAYYDAPDRLVRCRVVSVEGGRPHTATLRVLHTQGKWRAGRVIQCLAKEAVPTAALIKTSKGPRILSFKYQVSASA